MSIYHDPISTNRRYPKTIKFVSAGCATGKTRAVCHHMRDNLDSRNFIYCGRSIDLIKETAKTLSDLGVTPKIITSDDPAHEWRVKTDIAAFLDEAPKRGAVLLITANARIDLTHSVDGSWEVFFDEVPQVNSYFSWMLPRHHQFITRHLEIDPNDDPVEGRMLVKVRRTFDSELGEIVRGVQDDVDNLLRPFYLETLSPGKDVFVHLDSFQRVFERKEIATERGEEEANKVHFISMLRPEPFLDATIIGANIEELAALPLVPRLAWRRVRRKHGNLSPLPQDAGDHRRTPEGFIFHPRQSFRLQTSFQSGGIGRRLQFREDEPPRHRGVQGRALPLRAEQRHEIRHRGRTELHARAGGVSWPELFFGLPQRLLPHRLEPRTVPFAYARSGVWPVRRSRPPGHRPRDGLPDRLPHQPSSFRLDDHGSRHRAGPRHRATPCRPIWIEASAATWLHV